MSYPYGLNFDWTDERVAELRRLAGQDLSTSQIAAEMGGGLSKNAVIGKARRLGIALRARSGDNMRAPRPRAARSTPFRPKAVLAPPIAPAAPVRAPEPAGAHRCDLLALTNNSCRWPVTESSPWLFCGEPTADLENGRPWCPYHHRIGHDRRSEAA